MIASQNESPRRWWWFDGWVRESDGYPLKYQITQASDQGSNALTLTFDKYNTGESITAPPASQVVQG